jgi:hypothetical protein
MSPGRMLFVLVASATMSDSALDVLKFVAPNA